MIYLVLIIMIMCSYKLLEVIISKLFPKMNKDQLWTNQWYYLWGIILLITYFIIKPCDYIFKMPINNEIGVIYIMIFVGVTFFACFRGVNSYYPKKANKLKCFHFGVVQPVFEEVAFRGLILSMTISILGNSNNEVVWINGVLFMIFHLNYWSFNKKHINLFLNFFLLGVAFTYLAIMTQSIIYSIICHIILNSCHVIYGNYKLQHESK